MYVVQIKLYHEEAEGASAVATLRKRYNMCETAVYAVVNLTENLTTVVRTAGIHFDEVEARIFKVE